MQDALEAAVEGDDKGKLEQHLQANEAQACLLVHQKSHSGQLFIHSLNACHMESGMYNPE